MENGSAEDTIRRGFAGGRVTTWSIVSVAQFPVWVLFKRGRNKELYRCAVDTATNKRTYAYIYTHTHTHAYCSGCLLSKNIIMIQFYELIVK